MSERSKRGYKIFSRSKKYRDNYDAIRWDREEQQLDMFEEEETHDIASGYDQTSKLYGDRP